MYIAKGVLEHIRQKFSKTKKGTKKHHVNLGASFCTSSTIFTRVECYWWGGKLVSIIFFME